MRFAHYSNDGDPRGSPDRFGAQLWKQNRLEIRWHGRNDVDQPGQLRTFVSLRNSLSDSIEVDILACLVGSDELGNDICAGLDE